MNPAESAHPAHPESPARLSVIPLGGVEEIGGLNMTVIEYGNDMIVVDAGLMFPEEDMPGVDFVIPDITYLLENRDRLRGIILTHGHEDHTGALPFVLKALPVPVYGTPLTLALVQQKLREYELEEEAELIPVRPRDVITLGSLTVEFIRVTHSIVDGVALGIKTPLGSIIHTGDFKLDPTPVDGELMDFHTFSRYGEEGTLLMLSDSTNAGKGGFTFSEKEVRRAFEDIFAKKHGRIIIATFASNIHRVQQVIDVAVQFGRKVFMCGRSMLSNAQIALELGYLNIPEKTWLTMDRLKEMPDNEVVILTTGSQGEPMSVLSRIATDEHKHISIREGDTVILSAKMIPGNERSIGRIINHLMMRGADVKYERTSEIHVSGHASKEELKLMMNIVRPRYFVPIHGEYRHLSFHARLAEKSAIPKENIFILGNGSVLELSENGPSLAGKVHAGRIFIDGKGAPSVEDIVLRDRRRLGHDGIVIVLVGIEKKTRQMVIGPEIISRGFVFEDVSQDIINEVRDLMTQTIMSVEEDVIADISLLQAKLRSRLKKYLRDTMDRYPMIMPIILEV
ncbi:MAG TPA: ribonuclease J [Dissulfurispiraceae bacterium]|nr:ribonuclease J [Dissulfurispiraceae bacterium]